MSDKKTIEALVESGDVESVWKLVQNLKEKRVEDIKKAFEAGQLHQATCSPLRGEVIFRYETVEDYLKELNKEKDK